MPLLYAGIVATVLITMPPLPLGWGLILVAIVGGGGFGWQRARLMRLEWDGDSRQVTTRQSPAALLLLLGIVGLRRLLIPSASAGAPPSADALMLTDALLGFALGMITSQRLAIWRAAQRLIAIHDTADRF